MIHEYYVVIENLQYEASESYDILWSIICLKIAAKEKSFLPVSVSISISISSSDKPVPGESGSYG